MTGARSICLDAYAEDSTGKKYDMEVQRSDNGADPHRARYHSSVMDVENLDEKQDYRDLPDTYVIFITEKDYYKVKNTDGVINFIGKGKPQAIRENEIPFINWLWNNGKPIEPSRVFVTVDGRKMIMSGPLRKYGGEYASIDIRQRRAKTVISICGIKHKVTLPIELI